MRNQRSVYLQAAFMALVSVLSLTGCEKYLKIQPEDQYTEDQVFGSETSIQQALNGLYVHLGGPDLYGFQLSQYAVEYLGQRYTVSDVTSSQRFLQEYAYDRIEAAGIFNGIWVSAYQNILQTNKLIEKLTLAEEQKVLSAQYADLLHGEALAIRGLLHFDLLRLFGPVYSLHPEAEAIPYYRSAKAVPQPFLDAKSALDAVIADLKEALILLANDPVISQGITATGNQPFYTANRNRRLNYYAVKGLLARAYLYGGYAADANRTAKEVLEEGEKWFGWLPYTDILSAGQNPDRIFSTEVIFGVDNRNMYENYMTYFGGSAENHLYAVRPEVSRLATVFENNTNDYRYPTTWILNQSGWRTFTKFADIQDKSKSWRFLQPLLRKSELYYILAETETDPGAARAYLDAVRFNRGLGNLGTGAVIQDEITKEYQKEFYGEGQLFFYYKRRNMLAIPGGTTSPATIAPKYVVPVPESETKVR